jgi:5'-methylthioadenosine phosphorylase
MLGVELILSWNGVGAINPILRVGDAIVPAAIMDWTRTRMSTFGEVKAEGDEPELFLAEAAALRSAARTIDHIQNGHDPKQVARPFDEKARLAIATTLNQSPISNLQSPTYVCTEGPRLETAAEIQLAADLGADIVGMTLCPELWLAAELGLAYASLCLVTNFATGRQHLDPRRNFGPSVAERGMQLLLAVAKTLTAESTEGAEKKRANGKANGN